ncbi:hypothetical protein [Flavobacterium sp.]|uniref:hypothetical protein n=1 Tax=Flavobacterium sp. TaxID=239 RepID=UPI003750D27E
MPEIKNQNTLYRFVSLRSPELLNVENQEKRFVFHPENFKKLADTTGVFFNAVKTKPVTQSKRQALEIAATTFSATAYQNKVEVESINLNFFKVSDWLMRNKSQATTDEILAKVETLTPLQNGIVLNLWDNYFYQILTQKDFYIKESINQLLILQNLITNIQNLTTVIEKSEFLIQLSNATVVLPSSIFDEQVTTDSQNIENDIAKYTSKQILDAQENLLSSSVIDELQNLILEIQTASKVYSREYQINFDKDYLIHQDSINPLLIDYERAYIISKKALCANPRDANYDPEDFCNQPQVEYPKLPEFIFEYPKEADSDFFKNNLSVTNFQLLTSIINLDQFETFDQVINKIEDIKKVQHTNIVSKTQFSQKVVTIGDAVIPVGANSTKIDDFTFNICSKNVNGKFNPYMTIQVPNTSYILTSIVYDLGFINGTHITDGAGTISALANTISIFNMFGIGDEITEAQNDTIKSFSGTLNFTNGMTKKFKIKPFSFSFNSCTRGFLADLNSVINQANNQNDFKPKGFGFRQLGIADYKKVVSHVCCYDAGEVAHIENIMAKELRSKTTTSFHQTQTTQTDSVEVETEKLTDTTSTERFEMQTEIAKIMQEDKNFTTNVNAKYSYGDTFSLDASASYATNVSKEESNRQAVIQGKELTQRASERIVSRVKSEKIVKVTDEFTEENVHAFDNRLGENHVSGVFRFINATYKNQIFNYGKRLMYEFMVPQPSKFHRLGMEVSKIAENAIVLEKPIDPRTVGYANFTNISEANYQALASTYEVEVNTHPKKFIFANKTISTVKFGGLEVIEGSYDITIEKGYKPTIAKLKFAAKTDTNTTEPHTANISFGNHNLIKQGSYANITQNDLLGFKPLGHILDEFTDKVSFSYALGNYHSCSISLSVKTEPTEETILAWKKETFEKIIAGYKAQLEKYNENLASAKATGVQITESNPLFYRQIEQLVLRKNCISYLIDDTNTASNRRFGRKMYNNNPTFTNHQVSVTQDMDDYGSFAKFMEQAFDWNLMSYNFYPFYWGNRDDWDELFQTEINDPIFRNFMQAGMCRVIVTVKPGFEKAVMHYMNFGQIWNGGQMPILGDPLYLSIVDELKEQEYTVEETWETVVPTSLIALQNSGVAVDATGLPCGDGCENHAVNGLIPNLNKLGLATEPIK